MLQSLQNKVIEHTIVKTKPGKKGKITTSTTTFAVTGAQVLVLAIIYGFVRFKDLGIPSLGGALGDLTSPLEDPGGNVLGFLASLTPPEKGYIMKYSLQFHNDWRRMSHDERMAWRSEYNKPDTWMPPGYPSFWS